MRSERTIGYILIAIGVLALLASVSGGAGFLWVGLLAAAAFVAYAYWKNYGFLVLGGILGGVALGILLESWGWDGGFLVCLGIGFLVIDRIEPRKSHWPVYVAAILVILGLITTLSAMGILGSVWFALVIIAVGVYLLYRQQKRGRGEGGDWVHVGPDSSSPPSTEAVEPDTTATPAAEESSSSAGTAQPAGRTAPAEPPAAEPGSVAMSEDEAQRTGRLIAWRKEQAESQGVPAYIVLPNATLETIARENPRTLEELDAIKGIGKTRLERYGETILAVLRGEGESTGS
jgi:hypothetical protein